MSSRSFMFPNIRMRDYLYILNLITLLSPYYISVVYIGTQSSSYVYTHTHHVCCVYWKSKVRDAINTLEIYLCYGWGGEGGTGGWDTNIFMKNNLPSCNNSIYTIYVDDEFSTFFLRIVVICFFFETHSN